MSNDTVINLTKDEKINLTKDNPGLTALHVGLGWDEIPKGGGKDYDLDAFVILLEGGKFTKKENLIYFGNLTMADGSVIHTGDNLTGKGDGDDEIVYINLDKIAASVDKLIIGVNIYKADEKGQKFGAVKNASMRLVNKANDQELAKYDLAEDYSKHVGVEFGELYRHNGEWKFGATGVGFEGSLQTVCDKYK